MGAILYATLKCASASGVWKLPASYYWWNMVGELFVNLQTNRKSLKRASQSALEKIVYIFEAIYTCSLKRCLVLRYSAKKAVVRVQTEVLIQWRSKEVQ